jgi:hypothetical protein
LGLVAASYSVSSSEKNNRFMPWCDIPWTLLIAGLFGFDKLGFDSFPKLQFYYWGGIPEALRKLGCRVLITKVPRYIY